MGWDYEARIAACCIEEENRDHPSWPSGSASGSTVDRHIRLRLEDWLPAEVRVRFQGVVTQAQRRQLALRAIAVLLPDLDCVLVTPEEATRVRREGLL